MKKIFLLLFSILLVSVSYSQAILKWEKSFGGSRMDVCYSLIQTKEGGFLACGYTHSKDGDVTLNHDTSGLKSDAWVVLFDSLFNIQWQRSFGGTKEDQIYRAVQTFDGGFALSGFAYSKDGDLTQNHDTSCITSDIWVIKLSPNGGIVWQKSLGGTNEDRGQGIIATKDSLLLVFGFTQSHNGDIAYNHDSLIDTKDVVLFKLDNSGNVIWQKVYGGGSDDEVYDVKELSNRSLLMVCNSISDDHDLDSAGNHIFGGGDFWLVKLDSIGTILADTCYGGDGLEVPVSVQSYNDSMFVAAGITNSKNGSVTGYTGVSTGGLLDCWVVGFSMFNDSTFRLDWNTCLGGPGGDEVAQKVLITPEKHLIVTGVNTTNSGMVTGNHGETDIWCVELDSAHQIVWKTSLGGSKAESGFTGLQLTNGNVLLGGESASSDGNVSSNNGETDMWILELEIVSASVAKNIFTHSANPFPNPGSGYLNIKNPFIGPDENVRFSVLDMTGRLIFEKSVNSDSAVLQFDFPGLPAGMYMLQFENGLQKVAAKWVVQ